MIITERALHTPELKEASIGDITRKEALAANIQNV